MADLPQPGKRTRAPAMPAPTKPKPPFAVWSKVFLAELAATSNVAASAKKAGVPPSTAYDARRANGEFHRRWMEALCEGYDHLEMELLHRLRTGEIKPASGAKKGVRGYDNAIAYRLLVAHRDSVGRQRAVRSRADAEAIVQSINARLVRMRQHQLAAPRKEADAEQHD